MNLKIFLVLFLIGLSSISYSQLKKGDNLLGPTLGFWTYNSVPTFGVNYENQIEQFGDACSFGLGGLMRYSAHTVSSEYGEVFYDYKYTYFLLGAQGNFNFNRIGDGKFVPFVGLVLGYDAINYTATNNGYPTYSASESSGFWLWVQGGVRYFFSPHVAGVIRIGVGNFNFNVLELGVDFKF